MSYLAQRYVWKRCAIGIFTSHSGYCLQKAPVRVSCPLQAAERLPEWQVDVHRVLSQLAVFVRRL